MSGHPSQSRLIGGGNIVKVPYPYCYRCGFEKEPETCGLFCLHYIEDYILEFVAKPEQIGAVIVEAVQCDGVRRRAARGFPFGDRNALQKTWNAFYRG